MGSPLASIFADIFMNNLLEKHIIDHNQNNGLFDVVFSIGRKVFELYIFGRYVDDTIAAF